MGRKKKQTQSAITTEIIGDIPTTTFELDLTFQSLGERLVEVNKTPGVTGYLLKNPTSAEIDLKFQEELSDYAILSAKSIETAQELSNLFELGKIGHILIEGKNLKMLCMLMGENTLAIFMEKAVDHAVIVKRLLR